MSSPPSWFTTTTRMRGTEGAGGVRIAEPSGGSGKFLIARENGTTARPPAELPRVLDAARGSSESRIDALGERFGAPRISTQRHVAARLVE